MTGLSSTPPRSLARFLGLNSGWMSRFWTYLSWWGLGSVWFWVSHSPHRIFNLVGSCWNLAAQWAAVRMTPGAMRELVEVHSLRFSSIAWILSNGLLSKDGTHVRPLPELGLVLVEALDPNSESVLVPLATLGHVLHNWRRGRGDEVGVQAAYVQKSRALAVLRTEDAKAIPDVDEATA